MSTPADITLAQLGGARRIKIMTGARNFLSDDKGQTLVIAFPKNLALRVRLDPSDTYSVWTTRVTRRGGDFDVKTSDVISDVFVEDLMKVCEKAVGLSFHL